MSSADASSTWVPRKSGVWVGVQQHHIGRVAGCKTVIPKALEDDAVAFCMKAKEYDLILVPSDSFGVPG